jgi:hypothetical protein
MSTAITKERDHRLFRADRQRVEGRDSGFRRHHLVPGNGSGLELDRRGRSGRVLRRGLRFGWCGCGRDRQLIRRIRVRRPLPVRPSAGRSPCTGPV